MPVTSFITSLPPALALFLISLTISLLITVVYKFTTNQAFMKMLHSDMKSLRNEIKQAKDTAQAAELNKRLMEKTMQQIMHSMKSTFITIIPIFFIIGWMNTNLAFTQVAPGQEFTTSMEFEDKLSSEATLSSETLQLLTNSTQAFENAQRVEWKLKGDEGAHALTYTFDDETYGREVIITNAWRYADPVLEKKRTLFGIINLGDKAPIKPQSSIKRISVELEPTHPFGSFQLFGWKPGWLATYFLFTLLLTFPIRKLLKVH